MNPLEIAYINVFSPYKVWNRGEVLYFETDYGCRYSIDFDIEENPYLKAYWINLNNLSHIASHNDMKILQTVLCVVEEFFRVNPDILLYICSTAGGQQAQRARLFQRWFNHAEQQSGYLMKLAEVKGEGQNEYVAMIIGRNHPKLEEAIALFNHDTQMFNLMKP